VVIQVKIKTQNFCAYCESFDVFCETCATQKDVFLPRQIGKDYKNNIKQRKPTCYARIYL
jgi:hypothetical protein